MLNHLGPIKSVARRVLGPAGTARAKAIVHKVWNPAKSPGTALHEAPPATASPPPPQVEVSLPAPPASVTILFELIARFCVGRGIEIGPGRSPLCSRSNTIFLDRFTDNQDATVRPDIVSDAARLPIRDGAFDFLLSSHMLEHHQDTIRTLDEWKRVLKPGGVMFLILPHHARTLDRHRAITSLQHHIDDYAQLGDREDHSHFEELQAGWSKLDDFEEMRAQFEKDWNMEMWDWAGRMKNGVIHFHVWSQNEMVDLFRHVGLSIEYVADVVPEIPVSFLVIGRR